jgi:uracil-DNA glycosylase
MVFTLEKRLNPQENCTLCPRLHGFINQNKLIFPSFFNAPVPSFAAESVKLLIVGLAPGLKGANRTGRPFTGDYAGELLYSTLKDFGFASGDFKGEADDGVMLINSAITNAVRCVPPENKPTPLEINTCRQFLIPTLKSFPQLKAILTLGKIAHESTVRALGLKPSAMPFKHGAQYKHGALSLFSSYHCSRYNTNTGVLTHTMFRDVFKAVEREIT